MNNKKINSTWKKIYPTINIITSKDSWVGTWHPDLKNYFKKYKVKSLRILKNHTKIKSADITFFLGYYKYVEKKFLLKSKLNLVIHESNLPKGRGFAPLTWQILKGKNKIIFTIFKINIEDSRVDSGNIFFKKELKLNGLELIEEIRLKSIIVYKYLINKVLNANIKYDGYSQYGKATHYRKRTSKDSELDLNKTLRENFSILRIADNNRYPAFFKKKNKVFILKIYPKI